MSTRFFYDGQGKIVDEEGNDIMDWAAEPHPFHLKTLTRIRLYSEAHRKSNRSKENVELDTAMEEIEESIKKQTKHYNQYFNEQNPSLFITIELSCSTLPNLAVWLVGLLNARHKNGLKDLEKIIMNLLIDFSSATNCLHQD